MTRIHHAEADLSPQWDSEHNLIFILTDELDEPGTNHQPLTAERIQ